MCGIIGNFVSPQFDNKYIIDRRFSSSAIIIIRIKKIFHTVDKVELFFLKNNLIRRIVDIAIMNILYSSLF
ncbi:MAG: hypothetical protein QXY79_03950, partial [Candidatus Methanomethylicia archaeon]